jgi:hypothetical protein
MQATADERGVVIAWLSRLVLVLAIGGLLAYDAGAMLVNYFTLGSSAEDLAYELSADIESGTVTPRAPDLANRAEELARGKGVRLLRAEVGAEGILHVAIKRRAETLLAQYVDAFNRYARPVVTATVNTA